MGGAQALLTCTALDWPQFVCTRCLDAVPWSAPPAIAMVQAVPPQGSSRQLPPLCAAVCRGTPRQTFLHSAPGDHIKTACAAQSQRLAGARWGCLTEGAHWGCPLPSPPQHSPRQRTLCNALRNQNAALSGGRHLWQIIGHPRACQQVEGKSCAGLPCRRAASGCRMGGQP